MRFKSPLLAVGVLLSAATLNAQAALVSYTGAGGVGLVYSSVSNVTWTQNANLFLTMASTNANLISEIASVTPSYNDPSHGLQTIDADDFYTVTGEMTWWGANAWVNYLNSISYGGSDQWRLPTAGSDPQSGFNQTGGELGQLFYNELGGIAGSPIPDTSTFDNEQAYGFWSGTEYAPDPYGAWYFDTNNGTQYSGDKDNQFSAWAVSRGQVAAVPVPAAAWLFGPAVLGLLGFKRRGQAG